MFCFFVFFTALITSIKNNVLKWLKYAHKTWKTQNCACIYQIDL